MNYLKIIYLIIIVAFCNTSYSQSELAKKVMHQLKSEKTNWYEELIIEKPMPNSNDETIIILPEFTDSAEMYFLLRTWIIIAESSTGKIKNKMYVIMESDASVLTRFEIDTASYQLSNDSKAFGLRTVYRGSSRPNPYDYESITLFVRQKNVLKIVLADLVLKQFDGEWDTNCAGEFTTQNKILIMTKNLTNGYYDILVKNEIIKETTFVNKIGECDRTEIKTVEKSVIKYQNGKYK